jgi:vitamin K-dependent gamma-carboxylase
MVFSRQRLREVAARPVDAASLAFVRIAFGLALVVLALRFFAHGWIAADYVVPRHFFTYWGLSWIHPWPSPGMYVHYAVMALSALCIAVGFAYRPACIVFVTTFTYAHFCDKANYLNHYYLVSLVTTLMVFLPLDREGSLRVFLRPADRRSNVPAWVLQLLRFQFAVVYVFGAIAKMESDWLVHGEPLRIWLAANVELPALGRLFDKPWVAVVFSWCGMLFDLTIVPLLLFPKTRRPAYLVAIVFHVLTALLFKIGMFPWLMLIGATLFFDPSWARTLFSRFTRAQRNDLVAGRSPSGFEALLIAAYVVVQLLLPLRHALYPGNTLWSEEGFRYAWRIMLIEKSGELQYTVVDAAGRRTLVEPREYLTPYQTRQAATQPDLVLELAHIIARDFDARGVGPVRVYADARVSFNGRASAPLVDPAVDLAAQRDTLAAKPWILPAPRTASEF